VKSIKSLLVGIILTALLFGCTPGPAATEPARVEAATEEPAPVELVSMDVCYSSISAHQSVIQYAIDNGFFAKHGLEINLTYIESGTDATIALLSGDVSMCVVAGSSIVNAAVAGEDVKIIAGVVNTHIYSLIVQPGITDAEGLRGQSVGVSDFGGSSDTAMRIVLQSMGLDPDKDVTILAVGGTSDRLAALEAGQIAATVVSPPSTVKAVDAGFVELVKMSDLNTPYQHTTISASQAFLDANHETALNFLKAMHEAAWAMKHDQPGTYATIAKFMELDPVADENLLAEAFQVSIQKYVQFPMFPTVEGIQVLLDELLSENPAAADFTPGDIINTSLMDELEASGFFDEISQP